MHFVFRTHHLINRMIFERKTLYIKLCSDFPCNSTISHCNNNSETYCHNFTNVFMKSTRYSVEIKYQLDATEVFISDLIAYSTCFGHHYAHHQELKSNVQWLLPVVFRAVVFKLLVWCGAEGYVSGLRDVVASCKPDT